MVQMIKKCSVLLLVFFFTVLAVEAKKSPNLVLSSYKVDFGKVSLKDKTVSAKLKLKNKGNALLIIESYNATCSCVKISDFPEYLVRPGNGFEFNVSLHYEGYRVGQKIVKYVNIYSNSKKTITRIKVLAQVTN